MQLEELVAKLEGVRGRKALCPAHEDRQASLTFGEGEDGTILLTCFAGCSVQSICDALGVRVKDLFPAQEEVTYTYNDENGLPLYNKIRKPDKQFVYERYIGNTTETGLGDTQKTLYRLDELVKAPRDQVVWIAEGEKDVEALRGAGALATTAGGANDWRSEYADYFHGRHVRVVQDKDEAGRSAAVSILMDLMGVVADKPRLLEARKGKDAYDHLQAGYDLGDFVEPSHFHPLDFTKPVVEPPSLWEGYVYEGDLVLAAGAPKLGKSWIIMALAVAVAQGHEQFLGARVKSGRVLYFDEENPEDVIRRRMLALGLSEFQNVRYVANGGLRLDTHPDLLMQEALLFQPDLIAIDSLARVHAKDENSFSEMSEILNGVLKPLARKSGAAVILIHHHDKAGNGPRGSSDIEAAVDCIMNVRGTPGSGNFTLNMKGRRRKSDQGLAVSIRDYPGVGTRLEQQ